MLRIVLKRKARASPLPGIFFAASLYGLAVISHFVYGNQFFTVYFGLVALLAAIVLLIRQRHK